jgi:nickel/cobalt exporter
MSSDLGILAVTAVSVGVVHTITGPDHFLPFVVIGRARRWSLARTLSVTVLCGLGHVASSVVIGLVGIALGVAVARLEFIEGMRGNVAAWLLISFGLVYAVWGLRRGLRGQSHSHAHVHADGTWHRHDHAHHDDHAHVHAEPGRTNLTPWILFVIFVFGPCEPLIPIVMYPAAHASRLGLLVVTGAFCAATLTTMLIMVTLGERGVRMLPLARLERYTHALAGAAILASGLAIQFLGL